MSQTPLVINTEVTGREVVKYDGHLVTFEGVTGVFRKSPDTAVNVGLIFFKRSGNQMVKPVFVDDVVTVVRLPWN